MEHAARLGRQAGKFRLDRRTPRRRHAVYRSADVGHRGLDARRSQARHVDFTPTYDERRSEPTVLPLEIPESDGQWREWHRRRHGHVDSSAQPGRSLPWNDSSDRSARCLDRRADGNHPRPRTSPREEFICGRSGIRRGYYSGRGTIALRARTRIEEFGKNRFRIVVNEIPFQQARDRVEERIADLVNEDRVKGISAIRNESDLKEPVRLILELKRDADPEIVLNQLYQFSPLQDTFSLNFLALVDGKPRTLSLKSMLEEFLRHRAIVIRRRTQFLLAKARSRKHTVEGLLLAFANIDEVIRVIRSSKTQAEAKARLMGIEAPAAMLQRALGDVGFAQFQGRPRRERQLHAHRHPVRRHP